MFFRKPKSTRKTTDHQTTRKGAQGIASGVCRPWKLGARVAAFPSSDSAEDVCASHHGGAFLLGADGVGADWQHHPLHSQHGDGRVQPSDDGADRSRGGGRNFWRGRGGRSCLARSELAQPAARRAHRVGVEPAHHLGDDGQRSEQFCHGRRPVRFWERERQFQRRLISATGGQSDRHHHRDSSVFGWRRYTTGVDILRDGAGVDPVQRQTQQLSIDICHRRHSRLFVKLTPSLPPFHSFTFRLPMPPFLGRTFIVLPPLHPDGVRSYCFILCTYLYLLTIFISASSLLLKLKLSKIIHIWYCKHVVYIVKRIFFCEKCHTYHYFDSPITFYM